MKPEQAQEMVSLGFANAVSAGEPQTHFIVKLKKNRESNLQQMQLERLDDDLSSLSVASDFSAQNKLNEHIQNRDIEFIEPDYPTFNLSLDPQVGQQWAHPAIHSEQAWSLSTGKNVVVAVIDSGVDYTHQDLAANMWRNSKEVINGIDDDGNGYIDDIYGWDFANNDRSPMADDTKSYHGTHVAGTIGAVKDNNIGISGHAPSVRLMALKYLNSGGSGVTSNAIKAIDYAIKNGAKILSNSWGSTNFSEALYNAINKARQQGVLFLAAAGNGGSDGVGDNIDNKPFYPAAYNLDNIISVAATTSSDSLASWSNYGVHNVDLAAPGSSIYSTRNGNAYATLSGTSMATPLVSGVAALVWAYRPDLNYLQVKEALMKGSKTNSKLAGKVASGGRLDAELALQVAQSFAGGNPVIDTSPNAQDCL